MRDPDLHQAKNWIRILFDLICKYIYIYYFLSNGNGTEFNMKTIQMMMGT